MSQNAIFFVEKTYRFFNKPWVILGQMSAFAKSSAAIVVASSRSGHRMTRAGTTKYGGPRVKDRGDIARRPFVCATIGASTRRQSS
jgi:hypothetical protein